MRTLNGTVSVPPHPSIGNPFRRRAAGPEIAASLLVKGSAAAAVGTKESMVVPWGWWLGASCFSGRVCRVVPVLGVSVAGGGEVHPVLGEVPGSAPAPADCGEFADGLVTGQNHAGAVVGAGQICRGEFGEHQVAVAVG